MLPSEQLTWNSVFVDSNVSQLQYPLNSAAIHALGTQIYQQQMVVSATRHQLVAQLIESVSHGTAVTHDLFLVCFELGCLGLLQGTCQA